MPRITLVDSRVAGISGDMLLGAVIDAGADLRSIQEVLELVPKHYTKCKSLRFEARDVTKHGIRARAADFIISEEEGDAKAEELIKATNEIAKASKLSEKAKSFALSSIRILVDVETKLHGATFSTAHLYEAGSTDTLADVFGVAAACDSLDVFGSEILATPVAVGGGLVTFSHGTLATPAPAVLEIARQNGIHIVGGPEAEELATPTGVAMLASLTKNFVETYPSMIPEKVGYGAGKKELVGTPNLLRVVLGRPTQQGFGNETVQVLETNLDDISGELLGHALQRILDAGAKDVWITPAIFKKSRPGHVLHAICEPPDALKISEIMMKETGTLGVRCQQLSRFILRRETRTVRIEIAGKMFEIRVKFARDGSGRIMRAKPEFEDVQLVAGILSVPAREVSGTVLREVMRVEEKKQ